MYKRQLYALLGALGMYLAYPMARVTRVSDDAAKGPTDRMCAILGQAEERLINLRKLGTRIGQPELALHLDKIADTGSQILWQLAEQPSLIGRSRRFLHVHLEGAERVARHYARTHHVLRRGRLESRFHETLVLIQQAFNDHRKDLAHHHLEALDVQIAVLQERLRSHLI